MLDICGGRLHKHSSRYNTVLCESKYIRYWALYGVPGIPIGYKSMDMHKWHNSMKWS